VLLYILYINDKNNNKHRVLLYILYINDKTTQYRVLLYILYINVCTERLHIVQQLQSVTLTNSTAQAQAKVSWLDSTVEPLMIVYVSTLQAKSLEELVQVRHHLRTVSWRVDSGT